MEDWIGYAKRNWIAISFLMRPSIIKICSVMMNIIDLDAIDVQGVARNTHVANMELNVITKAYLKLRFLEDSSNSEEES